MGISQWLILLCLLCILTSCCISCLSALSVLQLVSTRLSCVQTCDRVTNYAIHRQVCDDLLKLRKEAFVAHQCQCLDIPSLPLVSVLAVLSVSLLTSCHILLSPCILLLMPQSHLVVYISAGSLVEAQSLHW